MTLLTKEVLLAAQDLKIETVAVPEWGGEVRVRSMTGAARDAYEQWLMHQRGGSDGPVSMPNLRARMVALSVVDEAGKLMFDEADIEALGEKSARALDRVYAAATRLNAMGDKEIEALAKN